MLFLWTSVSIRQERPHICPCTPHGKPGQVGRTWGARPISSESGLTLSVPG
jgi:hypothetical protein